MFSISQSLEAQEIWTINTDLYISIKDASWGRLFHSLTLHLIKDMLLAASSFIDMSLDIICRLQNHSVNLNKTNYMFTLVKVKE